MSASADKEKMRRIHVGERDAPVCWTIIEGAWNGLANDGLVTLPRVATTPFRQTDLN